MSLVDELQQELPQWEIVMVRPDLVSVRSPTFTHDGMIIQGQTAREVIVRVRNVERIWALALGREGTIKPVTPSAGVDRPLETVAAASAQPSGQPNPQPTPTNQFPNSRGEICGECGSLNMMPSGASCMKCMDCGASGGCG